MKFTFGFICFLLAPLIHGQNFESQWTGHFSFSKIADLSQGNDKIVAAAENAVFTYDLSAGNLETITTIQGLSGEMISAVYYSPAFDAIIVGYTTGLIEVILEDKSVLKVVDILNKPTIPPNRKRINHFTESNGRIYIATGFGVAVYNLGRLEFGDTYIIGDAGQQSNVLQTAVHGGYVFASLADKIKRAPVNSPNLIDYNNWNIIFNFATVGLQSFDGKLYMINASNRLNVLVGSSFQLVATLPETNRNISATSQYLTVTSDTQSHVFDSGMNLVSSVTTVFEYPYSLTNSLAINNNVYLGTREHGVLEVPFGDIEAQQILPAGPLMNTPFGLDATPGQLWVVFGDVDLFFNPNPLRSRGVSQLEENIWTNIPYEDVFEARSLVHIKINPENHNEVYASSMYNGLLKIVDKQPVVRYNETNSALENAFVEQNSPSIRIYGSDFDSQGNLWFVQSGADDALKRLTTAGQIQGFDITDVIPNPSADAGLNNLKVSREGNIFFGASENGLVGYNPTLNKFKKIGENLGNGNLPTVNVRSLAFDNRNQLWIGTTDGLRVLYNVGGFFDENANVDAQQIIILDDGVPQELLYEQSITDIEVDGSNNKWVATATSGVFYFSPNGNETLLRFTKENSPLPSNNVLDIAIDQQSGVVYFATAKGLVAYNGSSTAPRDNLDLVRAYPNPVRPTFHGNVTIDGLTSRANVKITDVNGNLVHEQVSEGGSIMWDTTAFGKYRVASGVYFIMVTTTDAAETKIAKVMIIR